MKKNLKYVVFCTMSFLALGITANAEAIDQSKLENAYIIGTHIFTADGAQLTTKNIMLAAKTIESDDIDDMVIYFKPYGSDTWENALNNFEEIETPLGINADGSGDETYFTHIDLVEQQEATKKLQLNSALNIKTDDILTDPFGEDIKFNQESISISVDKNMINILETRGMKNWNNGHSDEQWYAILLDLGIPKERITSLEGYTIEEVDKTEANRLGATNENQFVVWLRGSDINTNKIITFVDNETNEAIALTFNFVGMVRYEYETTNEIVVKTEGVNYDGANKQFNIANGINEFVFIENGTSKTVKLVDDMWQITNTYPVFSMNGTSNLVLPEFGEDEPYKDEMTYNIPKVNITNEGNIITIKETDLLKSYNNGYMEGQWFGFILDLGIDPHNITSKQYGILEADILDAKRFGATSDTAFIIWLTEEDFAQGDLEFTFNNSLDVNDTITLTLKYDGITGISYESTSSITDLSNDVIFKDNMFVVGLDVTTFTFKEDGILKTAKKGDDWTFVTNLDFKGANKIEVENILDEEPFASYIKDNENAISVNVENNIINITKDSKLTSYVNNSGRDEQWYALIVDFGIDPRLLEVDGYTIEEVDILDAKRLGASSDTAFVIWLNGAIKTRELTFKHKDNHDVIETITINVTANYRAFDVKNPIELNLSNLKNSEQYVPFMKYNMSNISLSKQDSVITITENNPLIKYNNGFMEGKWFGFVLDLGFNVNDVKIIGNYSINPEDITDVSRYTTANENAFVMWLTDVKLTEPLELTFVNKNDETEFVTITFKFVGNEEYKVAIPYETTADITDLGDVIYENGIFVVDSSKTSFEFKEDGVLKTAKKDDVWTFVTNLDFKGATEIDTESIKEEEPFYDEIISNQEAIEVSVSSNEINVTKNKALIKYTNSSTLSKQWYALIVDFGIDPRLLEVDGYTIEEVDILDAKRLGATSDTAFVIWLNGAVKTRELTFKHKDNHDVIETITINVTANYRAFDVKNPIELNLSNLKNSEQYVPFMKYNMSNISLSKQDSVITITENNPLIKYNNGFMEGKWFGFVLDLGFNVNDVKIIGNYSINPEDITDVSRYTTANENAFVMWLTDVKLTEPLELTFVNKNDETEFVTITFKFVGNEEYKVAIPYETTADITDLGDVIYENGIFVVDSSKTSFEFKEDGVLKTAKKDDVWTFVTNLDFKGATEIDTESIKEEEPFYDEIISNQEAIEVSVSSNEINVTKNKALIKYTNSSTLSKQWYALIVDFGIDPRLLEVDGYTIEEVDILDAKRLGATSDTAFVIWLNGLDESRELTFKHKDNNDVTETIIVNVLTNYPTLNLNDIKKLDLSNVLEEEPYYEEMNYNNERVDISKEENTINIKELKPLKKYNNGYMEEEWYGFIIDLGINPKRIVAEGYTIEEIDILDAKRLGATSDTGFVIWLRGSDIDKTQTITFKNLDDEEDTLTITFNFDAKVGVLYETENEIISDVTYEDGMFIVDATETMFEFKDGEEAKIAIYKDGWNFVKSLELVTAKKSITDNLDSENDEHYIEIVANQNAISVDFESNVINVTKNGNLISYTNGSGLNKKWYGVIVDLGIDPNELSVEGYTIEEIDITDANRHGATGTEFILWLQADDTTREMTFSYKEYSEITLDVTINVVE